MKILILIYHDVQSFPPTLNQILYLADKGNNIQIISSNVGSTKWAYPANVKEISLKKINRKNRIVNAINFTNFYLNVSSHLLLNKYDKIIMYDKYSCLSYLLFVGRYFIKSKIWYHSHDCFEKEHNNSLNKLIERTTFSACDGFSFPSIERIPFYSINKKDLKKFEEIPNYASPYVFKKPIERKLQQNNSLKLVFSGAISKNRGILEILPFLVEPILDRKIELHLYTYYSEFTVTILELAKLLKIENSIFFHTPISYNKLSNILSQFDIGIAIYNGESAMDLTAAKSSNKLFEYGASGLPVLFLNKPNFKNQLEGKNEWIEFIELEKASFKSGLQNIITNYDKYSSKAIVCFNNNNSKQKLENIDFFSSINEINQNQ